MTQIPALSKAQWREDLQYLVDQLSDHHLNLYHTITQERFAEAVADLHAAIPLLQDAAIVVELLRLTALIGDGHTSFRSWEVFQQYPLDLFWFGNELRYPNDFHVCTCFGNPSGQDRQCRYQRCISGC